MIIKSYSVRKNINKKLLRIIAYIIIFTIMISSTTSKFVIIANAQATLGTKEAQTKETQTKASDTATKETQTKASNTATKEAQTKASDTATNEAQTKEAQAKETAVVADPGITAPSVILMEASTGQVIYEKNADESLHPASITKIMTLVLIFDALKDGKITLEDEVTVSEHAASMGGSQVFLEVGEVQKVQTMIKCISVASANDASVAMAEHIWGSEETFVAKMNERAQSLGMVNTNFVNCCGLDIEGHMTSTRDVALMSRELINKYPQIHDYSSIWMDTITHVTKKGETEFGLSNTNKLIKQYEWATGLKTGSTGLAKCCLAATALRNDIELIAVVLAAPDSKTRFSDAITLLNYGYGLCSIYKDDNPPILEGVAINGGIDDIAKCKYADTFKYLSLQSFDPKAITTEIQLIENLAAPIKEGTVLGQLVYKLDGAEIGAVEILASENIREAKYLDSIFKVFKQALFH